ncbi:MAG: pyridoxamine 5'-phosphate oxidase [Gammaproteobacteria bacterium]|jgi:pyridoxamine 5'-phosphate oxidase|nr:pyridoxamine 5'-phosphate oxidase [Gammaproteobacteria bacterium]MBT6041977.1 pyridoxamine 5'-phosphate oxidase [Gammaproteobacteria bacterium]
MDIENFRREYLQGGLRREDLDENPTQQFQTWLDQVIGSGLKDPTAMVISTVSDDGQPSQRIVLLKHFDETGFIFYTNYGSRKVKEIAENDRVSLLFAWNALDRQVKICGRAEKISAAESVKYFLSRPRDSQLAAWASDQSRKITSRDFLMTQLAHMKEKFAEGEVPLPDFWGGIRVVPFEMEFWQGGEHRLHDRFEYTLQGDRTWEIQRLAP